MLGGRSSEQWIAQYASSHTHPVNRLCHSLGIPLIVVSLALAVAAVFYHPLWMLAAGLFVFGWLLQFIGHAFERKQPEFFHGGRPLVVGQDARQSVRNSWNPLCECDNSLSFATLLLEAASGAGHHDGFLIFPNCINPQILRPDLSRVARDATFLIWHRAAGTRPAR
jgi:hypothetical protein